MAMVYKKLSVFCIIYQKMRHGEDSWAPSLGSLDQGEANCAIMAPMGQLPVESIISGMEIRMVLINLRNKKILNTINSMENTKYKLEMDFLSLMVVYHRH